MDNFPHVDRDRARVAPRGKATYTVEVLVDKPHTHLRSTTYRGTSLVRALLALWAFSDSGDAVIQVRR